MDINLKKNLLEEKYELLAREISSAESRLLEKNKDIENAEKDKQSLLTEIDSLKMKLDAFKKDTIEEIYYLSTVKEDLKNDISKKSGHLSTIVESMKNHVERNTKTVEAGLYRVKSLRDLIKTLESEVESNKLKIAEQEEIIKNRSTSVNSVNKSLSEIEKFNELAAKRADEIISEKLNNIKSLDDQIKYVEGRIALGTADINKKREELEEDKKNIRIYTRRLEELYKKFYPGINLKI